LACVSHCQCRRFQQASHWRTEGSTKRANPTVTTVCFPLNIVLACPLGLGADSPGPLCPDLFAKQSHPFHVPFFLPSGRAGQNAQFAGTGQRADSVHLVEKLCSFYPLDHHRHTRERAGMRDRGGSAVGARYIVRGETTRHNCSVLNKNILFYLASAPGLPLCQTHKLKPQSSRVLNACGSRFHGDYKVHHPQQRRGGSGWQARCTA
jgi:hypothetical protein